MEALIQVRRGTAAQWLAANPVLASGEPGLETDTGKGKYGDGVKIWTLLPYSWAGADAAALKVDIYDEGISKQDDADRINFVGPGVTVTGAAGVATVTIPGTSGSGTTIPPGTIARWGGSSTPPAGWYKCDGLVHSDLIPIVGTNYGPAGATPTLNFVPDDMESSTISTVVQSVSAGWACDAAIYSRSHGIASWTLQFHRTGANISQGVNHTDIQVATLKGIAYTGVRAIGGSCINCLHCFNVTASGTLNLTCGFNSSGASPTTGNINTGDVFNMAATFPNQVINTGDMPVYWIIKAP